MKEGKPFPINLAFPPCGTFRGGAAKVGIFASALLGMMSGSIVSSARAWGTRLLRHVEGVTDKRILIGTWAAARWAIDSYLRNGYAVLEDKDALLRRFWTIPERQIETSVVLGDARWLSVRR